MLEVYTMQQGRCSYLIERFNSSHPHLFRRRTMMSKIQWEQELQCRYERMPNWWFDISERDKRYEKYKKECIAWHEKIT